MAEEQAEQTLAVFVMEDPVATRRLLKVVQAIDKRDPNVKIVDAAIADRTKRGRVKVHQTEDTAGMKGGFRGGAIGVVVGTILLGPAGAVIGGAAGGIFGGLHNRFRDIGIDDKFMKQITSEVEKGASALFVQYEGDWSASIGAVQDAIKAENARLIHSTLTPETAAALRALVEPATEELGGEEVVSDYEIDTESEEEPAGEEVEEAAPEAAAGEPEPDDLTKISGLGPKASEVLVAAGIDSYARLARTSEPDLRRVFADAHATVPGNIGTWPMQASFAETGDWAGLKAFAAKSQPAASKAASAAPPQQEPDDLTNLVGIGPKAVKALGTAGISTYQALADANEPQLRKALHDADMVAPGNVATWPMQASYAVGGDWRGLSKYNQKAAKGKAPTQRTAPAKAATPERPDDLTQLSGIGARMASLLGDSGITTYAQLQHTSVEDLRGIVASGGALPPSSLPTWPTQASYAVKGDWRGLTEYNKSHR
jgi:predicted flap endonuclease-1-like 5' DNA nuclease